MALRNRNILCNICPASKIPCCLSQSPFLLPLWCPYCSFGLLRDQSVWGEDAFLSHRAEEILQIYDTHYEQYHKFKYYIKSHPHEGSTLIITSSSSFPNRDLAMLHISPASPQLLNMYCNQHNNKRFAHS